MLGKLVISLWFIVHGLLVTLQPVIVRAASHLGPNPAGLTAIEELFGRIISLFVGLAFIALLVVLVWTGIRYLTSGGEPKALQSASQSLTWALLGMLFLVIAWLVLQLLAAFTGIEALKVFDIRTLCVPGIVGLCP